MLKKGNILVSGFLALFIMVTAHSTASGQSLKILAGSAFNGAVTGSMLGGATMAVQDDVNWDYVQVGVGGGIITGVGLGIYDVTRIQSGQSYYVSGTFNDGQSTSIIVLLDTFYGSATGALIGSAVMLMTDEYIVDGLQYGSGIGAWAGFGFGLVDAFLISNISGGGGGGYGGGYADAAPGIINMQYDTEKAGLWDVGLLSPNMVSQPEVKQNGFGTNQNMALNLLNLKVSL